MTTNVTHTRLLQLNVNLVRSFALLWLLVFSGCSSTKDPTLVHQPESVYTIVIPQPSGPLTVGVWYALGERGFRTIRSRQSGQSMTLSTWIKSASNRHPSHAVAAIVDSESEIIAYAQWEDETVEGKVAASSQERVAALNEIVKRLADELADQLRARL